MRHESGENKNRKVPKLNEDIARRLGEIGMSDIQNLPRRRKKTAKKVQEGRIPTQQQLSKLNEALRRQRGSE